MKKENLLTKINNVILKINRPALVAIVLIYAVILILLITVLFPKQSFVATPTFPHQITEKDMKVEITIRPTNRINSNKDLTTIFNIATKLEGNFEIGETERYEMPNFQMSSLLTSNKMLYFTEYSDRTMIKTTTHNYSINNSDEVKIPKEFYIRLKYIDKDDTEQTLTYEEKVLSLGNKRRYSNYNIIADAEKHSDKDRKTQVRIDFYGKNQDNDFSLRSMIEVVDTTVPYHIDMQSWVIADNGEVLMTSGIYGLNNKTVHNTSDLVPLDIKPQYVFSQLNYYEEGKEPQTIYYSEKISDLPETIADFPDDPTTASPDSLRLNTVEYIIIAVVGVGILYLIVKIIVNNKNKKKPNEKNIDKKIK